MRVKLDKQKTTNSYSKSLEGILGINESTRKWVAEKISQLDQDDLTEEIVIGEDKVFLICTYKFRIAHKKTIRIIVIDNRVPVVRLRHVLE
jgi:hypothetical protein